MRFCSNSLLQSSVIPRLALLYTASASLLLVLSAEPVHAAIMVQNVATQQSSTAAGDASFTFSNFDLNGGNFLAVLYSGERSEGGSDAMDVEVTFDGVGVTNGTPLDTVENEGAQIASVNYLLNPTSAMGDVVVTLPLGYRGAATVISLSGVAGVQDSATFGENLATNPWDEDLEGTAGGFILGAAVDNTFGAAASAPTFSGGFIDTETVSLNADFIPGDSSAGIVQGYGFVTASGTFTQTFNPGANGGNSSRNAGAYLSLVPEPSSFALAGLLACGGMALTMRKRIG